MTTKYLTGAYPSGYALSASYTGLVIESKASVGGTGVSASFTASIANYGQVYGSGINDGVLLGDGGSVTNGSTSNTTAVIAGYGGVLVHGASAAIANFATISASAFVGVSLSAGGTVTNGAAGSTTALIAGYGGVYASGAAATVVNFGTIEVLPGDTGRRGDGVDLYVGGSVTNGSAGSTTALIEGYGGVYASGAAATVVNFATIQGSRYGGVYLVAGGAVTNGSATDTTALITSGALGIYATGAPTTIANYGTIIGGVRIRGGGSVTNGSAADTKATIAGYNGVYAGGTSATITNFGTISGGHDNGVFLGAGGTVINGSATDTTALIRGRTGLAVKGAPAKIVNYGAIKGSGRPGVYLGAGARLINGSATDGSALISGREGVYVKSGSATVTNFGTITGTGAAAVDFVSAGNVLVAEAGGVFNGAVLGGGGTLDLASGMGTITNLAGGNVTVTGSLPTTTFTNFGTLGIGTAAQFTLTGSGVIASGGTGVLVDNGVFTVTGALAVAGKVKGSGTLTLAAGTMAVNAGGAISVAHLSLTGGTATINKSLTYKGVFSEGAGGTLTAAKGDTLALTGTTTLAGTVNGAGAVTVSHARVSGLTIGGTATLGDIGTVHQTGAVTLGDASSNPAILQIAAGATWAIENDSGVARGNTATSVIRNSGTFIKSGGTGVSVIAVQVNDAGSMVAATGTLDFTKALTGTGTMTVDTGATLEVDSTAAATLSMTFTGGNGVLALNHPSRFAATVNGFAPTDTIDLLGRKATSAVLGPNDTLVISNGTKAVATLQLAGTYTGDTFGVASDGNGGTDITVTAGAAVVHPAAPLAVAAPAHQFIAAMAGLLTPAAAAIHTGEAIGLHAPMLARPHAMIA